MTGADNKDWLTKFLSIVLRTRRMCEKGSTLWDIYLYSRDKQREYSNSGIAGKTMWGKGAFPAASAATRQSCSLVDLLHLPVVVASCFLPATCCWLICPDKTAEQWRCHGDARRRSAGNRWAALHVLSNARGWSGQMHELPCLYPHLSKCWDYLSVRLLLCKDVTVSCCYFVMRSRGHAVTL